jgi:hypothetical protein
MTRHAWGAELDDDDLEYADPDPRRHDVPDGEAKANVSWAQTLAALDGDAGLALYTRDELDDWAFADDFEPWEEP